MQVLTAPQLQAADRSARWPRWSSLITTARTAVALVATLLGAGAARVLAQPVEHRAGSVDAADVDDLSAMEESGWAGWGLWLLLSVLMLPSLAGWRVVRHVAWTLVACSCRTHTVVPMLR